MEENQTKEVRSMNMRIRELERMIDFNNKQRKELENGVNNGP